MTFRSHAGELCFEEKDMDGLLKRLEGLEVTYVHLPLEHRRGQRVVRR